MRTHPITGPRWLLAGAAAVAAVAHIPVIAPHLQEAPYMGVAFVLFVGGCAGVALMALTRPNRTGYLAGVALCGSAVAVYAATRLVAFPQLADDVGNWFEPLGVVSVLSELVVVGLGAWLALSERPALARSSA